MDLKERKVLKIILAVVFLQLVFYIYSLGATYVSNFSEYEAVRLASYQRYMNISYLVAAIVLIELGYKIYIKTKRICRKLEMEPGRAAI